MSLQAATDSAAAAAKWSSFYDRDFTPWDTQRPSSQLHLYLTTCPAEWAPGADKATSLALPPPSPPSLSEAGNSNGSCSTNDCTSSCTRPPLGPVPEYHRCSRCTALKPRPGASALEIGCGTGASCIHLARAGLRAVGVDLVPAAVAAAREAAAAAGVADRCVFVVADVLRLPTGFGWEEAQQLEREQVALGLVGSAGSGAVGSAAAAAAAQAATSGSASKSPSTSGFDLITDCQTFHVLWEQQDQLGTAPALARLLAPGGRLMLLTGNAEEPECGPAVLSEAQLRAAFPPADGWRWGWLLRTRFDETTHYREVLKKRPLAWWALLLRPGEFDTRGSGTQMFDQL